MPTIDARAFGAVQGSTTAGIQEAINALPAAGGTVYIPGSAYVITGPISLRRGVRLVGEGCAGFGEAGSGGPWDSVTKILCPDPNTNIITGTNADRVEISNMQITGAGSAGTQLGVKLNFASPSTFVQGIVMDNVLVEKCGSHGVQLDNCYISSFRHVNSVGNWGSGMRANLQSATLTNPSYIFDNCFFLSNAVYGADLYNVGPAVFRSCNFQANLGGANAYIRNSSGFHFDMCNWEGIEYGSGKLGLELQYCSNFKVSGTFIRYTPGTGKAVLAEACHHGNFDVVFMTKLSQGIHLISDGITPTHDIVIGTVTIPNGEHGPMVAGTEGTSGDYYNVSRSHIEQYGTDSTGLDSRDSAGPGIGWHPPLRVLGEMIYVRTPTTPATHMQLWNGTNWTGQVFTGT